MDYQNKYRGKVVRNLIEVVSAYDRELKVVLRDEWKIGEYVEERDLERLYNEVIGEAKIKAAYERLIGVPVVKIDIYRDCILIDVHMQEDKTGVAFNAAQYPQEIIIRCIEI
jgi:hypothetical protein